MPTQIDTSTNRMTKVTVGSELLDVGYDAAGNMTSHPGMGTFSYDAEGRLESAETISGNTRYVYDGEGRRVKKIRAASAVTYVYGADGKLLGEYGGTAEPGLVYLTMDPLGSTRMITKEGSGEAAVVSRHDYFPYGQEIPGSASYGQRINVLSYGLSSTVAQKFTGKERDAESGLDYFGARYLSSAMGRFTSPDQPFADQFVEDPQSWNLFGYGRNNPLINTDPTGRCSQGPDGRMHDDADGKCADVTSVTVTAKAPKVRDQAAEAQAEMTRLQYEAWRRNQERNKPREDQPLTNEAQAVLSTAYQRTVHDLGCAGLGFAVGDAGGALFVSGQPNAGFRSPVSGKLIGGSKPFASSGASAGSSTLSGALRDALPQRLPTQIPTPVGGPGTGRALSMQGSNRLGVVLGRWAPFVGVAGMAYGVYELNACLSQ